MVEDDSGNIFGTIWVFGAFCVVPSDGSHSMGADGPSERPDGLLPSISLWTVMDDGGERPGSAERGQNSLLMAYEFYYIIIMLEI